MEEAAIVVVAAEFVVAELVAIIAVHGVAGTVMRFYAVVVAGFVVFVAEVKRFEMDEANIFL